jgi:hypothetical protein
MCQSPSQSYNVTSPKIYPGKLKDDFIRLLQLEPGNGPDIIICSLRDISLKEAEDKYEAISYVWGDPDNQAGIVCNGIKHQITVSLDLALRTIRHATETKALWADAICINQNDDEEKGHQVKRMSSIYAHAKRVLIHLGPDDDGIAKECSALSRTSTSFGDKDYSSVKSL